MKNIVEKIKQLMDSIGKPVKFMEVCGTHTVAIFRHGIRDVIPREISLLSGPGCPVCVTPIRDVDAAIAIARRDGCILTTFGDMMRVPGSKQSLYHAQAEGAHITIVYSPMDAVTLAEKNSSRPVVFLGVGFETTAPGEIGRASCRERV